MSKQRQHRFLELYQPIHDRFERFCRARAYAEMPYEDLINETLLLAYQKLDKLHGDASFLSFLIGISIRLLANSRKKKKEVQLEQELILNNYPDPIDQIERKQQVDFLHQALALLPGEQREALILFEITGFRIHEIMKIQMSSQAAVKQRLSRGRKALRKIIDETLLVRKEGEYEG